MMDKVKIKELQSSTKKGRIRQYLQKCSTKMDVDDERVNKIAYSFQQSYAFLEQSEKVDLQVRPLFLYYASLNSFRGLITMTGKQVDCQTHGMTIEKNLKENILDTEIRFKSSGSLKFISHLLEVQKDRFSFGGIWKLRDFLDSIPEISEEYSKSCQRPSYAVPVEEDVSQAGAPIEKVKCPEPLDIEDLERRLENLPQFNKKYETQIPHKSRTIVLYLKAGQNSLAKSFSEGRYIPIRHKNEKGEIMGPLPPILNTHISLFALSYLCRYFPEIWNPFILGISGFKASFKLVKKFIDISESIIIDFLYNKLTIEFH